MLHDNFKKLLLGLEIHETFSQINVSLKKLTFSNSKNCVESFYFKIKPKEELE